jgi:DNA polymerase-3 subunit beta
MKFIVSSQLLVKNLQAVSGVINSSNTLPILDNFLFTIGENTLTVSASDLETTMTTTFKSLQRQWFSGHASRIFSIC